MEAKKLITELLERGAKFNIHTDVMYGRGINGVGFDTYPMYEELGERNNPKTKVYRTFEPKDDYLVIHEKYVHPEIPWNRAAEKGTREYNVYLGYERIAYIHETI